MKTFLFFIFAIFTILLGLNVFKILFYDLSRLTHYGIGYFTGKIILLLVFGFSSFFLAKKIWFAKKEA